MKKVLSVILALVLVFSISSIAASAHSAEDLETLVSLLPSRYNAYFYNDSTSELIYRALDTAEAALASGDPDEINAAYDLCQQAFDTAYETEVWYNEHLDEYITVCTNRDESKAVVDFYFRTDFEGDKLRPGDTFKLTVSLKTNFYLHVMYTGFIYDWKKFEYVDGSIEIGEKLDGMLNINPFTPVPRWEYALGSTDIPVEEIDRTRYPENWDCHFFDQYTLMGIIFGLNVYSDTYLYPTEPIDIYTLTFKVKDDATIGEIGRFFGNYDIVATDDNYLKGAYDYPIVEFHRGYGPQPFEKVTDVGGVIKDAYKCNDPKSYCSQTVNYNDEVKIRIVDDLSLDYTALDEAMARKDALDSIRFTDTTWNALEAAAAEGQKGYGASTQAEVDKAAKIVRDALDNLESEPEVISITPATTPMINCETELNVVISKPISKLRFINSDGGTLTYYPGSNMVKSITDNADGTQTWRVITKVRKMSEDYQVYCKLRKTWAEVCYNYTLKDATPQDADLISYKIADSTEQGGFDTDSVIQAGRHDVIVKADSSVTKVQLAYNGTTATFTADNAQVEKFPDCNEWKINFNFSKTGEGITYDFNSRTAKTAFKKSGLTATLDVVI
ncbi:MAG: hypothetical protein MJ120_02115 [Clostridia bacterium]|nr:hypothetical protein [Clostridia bacterium]